MTPEAYCRRCGSPLNASSRFCKRCGTRRVDDHDGSTAPQPSGAAQLAVDAPYPALSPSPHAATPPLAAGSPQGYAAQSQPRRHRAWVAGAAVAGVLLVVAVGLVLVLSSSGGTGVRLATVPTVTNPSATDSPNSTSRAAASPSTSSSAEVTPANPSPQPGPLRLVPYDGARMTASIPVSWKIEESEVQKPGEVESKWTNPANPNDYLLIDERHATHLTPEQDAAPVHASTDQTSGYREIYYGAGDLAGVGSWMWVFAIPEAERIDYFFERCTNSFGVLGSASPAAFGSLRPTFRAIAQSVQSTCR